MVIWQRAQKSVDDSETQGRRGMFPSSPGSLRSLIWCNRTKDSKRAGCDLKVHNRSRFSVSGVTEFSPHPSVVLVLSDPQSNCLSQLCCDIQTLPCWPSMARNQGLDPHWLSQLTLAFGGKLFVPKLLPALQRGCETHKEQRQTQKCCCVPGTPSWTWRRHRSWSTLSSLKPKASQTHLSNLSLESAVVKLTMS